MQLVMVGNQHQRSYRKKTMTAQNTINLGQISGEMKTEYFYSGVKILPRALGMMEIEYIAQERTAICTAICPFFIPKTIAWNLSGFAHMWFS